MYKLLAAVTVFGIAGTFHCFAKDISCGTNKPVHVQVLADGSLRWEKKPLTYAEVMRRFSEAANQNPMPNIQIDPDRTAKYQFVAKVLTDVRRTGFGCLGFTGIESGR